VSTNEPNSTSPSETRSGLIGEFAMFLTVKPGQADNLRKAALEYINSPARKSSDATQKAAALTGIHDIRLTVFDNDTQFLFATTFDTEWDPYVDDSLMVMQGVSPWGHFLQYTVEAPEGIEIPGKISNAAAKEFLNTHRVKAAAYENTLPTLTIRDAQKAMRVFQAFQQVLDHPDAAEALQHPALKPLLDEAAD